MFFKHFQINPNSSTFTGIVIGIVLVAAARAYLGF